MSTDGVDRSALIWGSVFTVLGAAFLLQEAGAWEVRAEFLLPFLLIAVGVVLLVSAVTDRREGGP